MVNLNWWWPLKVAPYGFLKSEKLQISTKKPAYRHFGRDETKVMHWITIEASSTVNRLSATSVAMTIVTYQIGRKFTFNPVYFENEFGDPSSFFTFKWWIGRFKRNSVVITQEKSSIFVFCLKHWIYRFF